MGVFTAAITTFIVTASHAGTILIGTPTGSNSFPFTFDGFDVNNRYQQVYAASNFTGPETLTAITFFNNRSPGAIFETADYTFSFSTSNFTVNNLDTNNLNNNPGADASLFASVNLNGATGSSFTIVAGTGGGSAFMYDPTAGDLLVDIMRANQTISSGSGFLDAMSGDSGGIFSRAHNYGSGTRNFGLVTEFTTSTTSIPEPGMLALFGLGLAGLGFARRRKAA
jgi:hypothetical protein